MNFETIIQEYADHQHAPLESVINANYQNCVGPQMANLKIKNIDESVQELNKIRKNGNFQTVKKEFGKEKLIELINTLYPKYDIKTIETILGVPDSTLSYWFNDLGIKFTRNHIINHTLPGEENTEEIKEIDNQLAKITTIKIDPDLAYLIGFTLGDGAIQKYQTEVFNQDQGMKNKLLKTMNQYGPVTQDERADGLWRLRLSNVKISNLIKKNKQVRKNTVEFIMERDHLATQFIAAFWDAEGSVLQQKNYTNIYLYNSNTYLLEIIGKFLQKNNIDFSTLKLKERRQSYFCKGQPITPKKQMHRISIPKSSRKKWAKLIGLHLLHSKKKKIIKEILKDGD